MQLDSSQVEGSCAQPAVSWQARLADESATSQRRDCIRRAAQT